MTGTSAIDLSRLPTPDIIETIDAETIVAAIKTDLLTYAPELASVLALESEPVVKLIEAFAFREVLLRARVNDAARAVLLATATGADLENLAAIYGVVRLLVSPANPSAIPPVAAVMEADSALRQRTQLALEGFSTAGPRKAYEFHARSASGLVRDIAVDSPNPGEVRVIVLSNEGSGAASPALLTAVETALNAEDVRPLCDAVSVLSASIIDFTVTAQVTVLDGPDPALVLASAQAALTTYLEELRAVGRPVRLSGLYAALHQAGVETVSISAPTADIAIGPAQSARCTSVVVTVGGA